MTIQNDPLYPLNDPDWAALDRGVQPVGGAAVRTEPRHANEDQPERVTSPVPAPALEPGLQAPIDTGLCAYAQPEDEVVLRTSQERSAAERPVVAPPSSPEEDHRSASDDRTYRVGTTEPTEANPPAESPSTNNVADSSPTSCSTSSSSTALGGANQLEHHSGAEPASVTAIESDERACSPPRCTGSSSPMDIDDDVYSLAVNASEETCIVSCVTHSLHTATHSHHRALKATACRWNLRGHRLTLVRKQ